ncbi:hypothetical protein H5410_061329 [Solanum commersonii]|uniref:Uncharacterized protein n=1 Tax=Solanum commersonii TaxID=4109 RepID=A0A9J5W7F2_SOLCO|nr:hypothetical protein H5410_061329 [Solanum commersonii]
MTIDICADHPSAFWNRKKHIVLPFNRDIKELICWKIIDGMLINLFQSIEETNTYYDAYWV